MTDPREESADGGGGRRRALLISLAMLVGFAVLVAVLSAESPSNETEPVTDAEPSAAAGTTGATEPPDDRQTTTDPPTAPEATPADAASPPTTSTEQPSVPRAGDPAEVDIEADLQAVLDSLTTGLDTDAVARLSRSGDLRLGWVIADLMRFINPDASGLRFAFTDLTGIDLGWNPWLDATNQLMTWDTPAPPGFAEWKGGMYTLIEPGWAPFFADKDSFIDWRHVTWGGVLIDDRPLDATHLPCPRGCIPALNDPRLVPASEGDYYPDDGYVFAVAVNGEAVAFPKNMMEVHEMVNITIGGRRLGIPYCTLCGSAQAYFTDEVPDPVLEQLGEAVTFELRTSGLLSRSNKMMYEFHTRSMFDTFTGQAVSGPLREAGVRLPQTTMVAARWGDWKEANPHSLIVAEDGGIGRSYPADPLRGRDDQGPIFPIGPWDDRLPIQEKVLGVLFEGGAAPTVVAFPVGETHATLQRGEPVEHAGIVVTRDGGGLRARGPDGVEIPSHEAFWFAWSQFHPGTELWRPTGA
ncbi:MAG: DUF3179 domain-containing (seleno)protein [bacterium]|nr:DUF3179 domain-containing (seleno)protein [bacterium]MDE0290511.1 DUF3179 domain-containing (seleno)protein [bacterium]MDE0436909.1 DUF3179 domain-containing (seleno)protein [bacterium]